MSRTCSITGKSYQKGNQVSHSNRKMIKRFMPNLQNISFYSEVLGKTVQLSVAIRTVRTIDKKGGLDAYLLGTPSRKLAPEAVTLKRKIRKAAEAKAS